MQSCSGCHASVMPCKHLSRSPDRPRNTGATPFHVGSHSNHLMHHPPMFDAVCLVDHYRGPAWESSWRPSRLCVRGWLACQLPSGGAITKRCWHTANREVRFCRLVAFCGLSLVLHLGPSGVILRSQKVQDFLVGELVQLQERQTIFGGAQTG